MISAAVVLILASIAVETALGAVDYRLATPLAAEIPKNCTAPGLLCETCSSLVVCVQENDLVQNFTKETSKTCASGEKCVKTVAGPGCTTSPDPFCDHVVDLAFPCTTVGIFPDPFYCNKFVLCIQDANKKLIPYSNNFCEDGYGYNPRSSLCDVKLDANGCSVDLDKLPLPICESPGQVGVVNGKPPLYFVCEEYPTNTNVLYPNIYVCPHGGNFDTNGYKCVSNTTRI